MTITKILLITALALAPVLSLFGQSSRDDTPMAAMKPHDLPTMRGLATVDTTVGGLHMKVWLITQQQHKDMMSGMKDTTKAMGTGMKGMTHEGMGMNKAMRDTMMAGTHHIMLEAGDAGTGKAITSAKVVIVSPSHMSTTVNLTHMMDHFGSALTLRENGAYRVTVDATVDGASKSVQFQYTVK